MATELPYSHRNFDAGPATYRDGSFDDMIFSATKHE